MGNSLSAIDDDIELYTSLCHRYGVEPVDVYSLHAKMLYEMHRECHYNIPPSGHSKRVERFKKDYEQAILREKNAKKQRCARFKILYKELSKEDLDILEEGHKNYWPTE